MVDTHSVISTSVSQRPPPEPDDEGWATVHHRKRRLDRPVIPIHRTGGARSRSRSGLPCPKSREIRPAPKFPVNAKAQKRMWSDIVATGCSTNPSCELEFFEPVSSNSVIIPKSDCEADASKWKSSLVLYVAGPRPYYLRLKETLNKLWKTTNMELLSRENGFFVASLCSEDECDRIIKSGPWMVDGLLLIVRRWTTTLTFEKDLLTSVPTWIRLPKLPLVVWNNKAISKIVSLLGRPIKMDENTANHSRVSYVRVLVEVNYDQVMKDKISIQIEGGKCFDQPIIYERLPPSCKQCSVFGHSDSICPIKLKTMWVRKANQGVVNATSLGPNQDVEVPNETEGIAKSGQSKVVVATSPIFPDKTNCNNIEINNDRLNQGMAGSSTNVTSLSEKIIIGPACEVGSSLYDGIKLSMSSDPNSPVCGEILIEPNKALDLEAVKLDANLKSNAEILNDSTAGSESICAPTHNLSKRPAANIAVDSSKRLTTCSHALGGQVAVAASAEPAGPSTYLEALNKGKQRADTPLPKDIWRKEFEKQVHSFNPHFKEMYEKDWSSDNSEDQEYLEDDEEEETDEDEDKENEHRYTIENDKWLEKISKLAEARKTKK